MYLNSLSSPDLFHPFSICIKFRSLKRRLQTNKLKTNTVDVDTHILVKTKSVSTITQLTKII